jgi:hypothetical protein
MSHAKEHRGHGGLSVYALTSQMHTPIPNALRAQRISHALAAGTDGRGQNTGLRLGVLLDLGDSVDKTADEADANCGHTGEGDWRIEEDETRHGDGQLVKRTNHGVGGGGGGADTPRGGVGNEDGGGTRQNHGEEDTIAVGLGEVAGEVSGRPVLNQQSENQQDGN